MILFPPAKINLGLRVLGKRPDGYNEIETCMLSIPWTDVIELLPTSAFEFKQTGLTVDGDSSNNLCVKAFRLMQERYTIPNVYLHLRKNIPMGAGLGGGSSDAAYVLRGLNAIFSLNLPENVLRDLALELGSDCPFFITDSAQIGSGRGEILTPIEINLSGYYLKLVNPEIHVSTKEAYAGVHYSDHRTSLRGLLRMPLDTWEQTLGNDFEESIFKSHPEIADVKKKLIEEGAIYASMSGSGSTVYGIFKTPPQKTFSSYTEFILAL
jgi:4-diphosphocytidyl-2-C-methyl-D-erythritol kinase